jgi:hypothetical protein
MHVGFGVFNVRTLKAGTFLIIVVPWAVSTNRAVHHLDMLICTKPDTGHHRSKDITEAQANRLYWRNPTWVGNFVLPTASGDSWDTGFMESPTCIRSVRNVICDRNSVHAVRRTVRVRTDIIASVVDDKKCTCIQRRNVL